MTKGIKWIIIGAWVELIGLLAILFTYLHQQGQPWIQAMVLPAKPMIIYLVAAVVWFVGSYCVFKGFCLQMRLKKGSDEKEPSVIQRRTD